MKNQESGKPVGNILRQLMAAPRFAGRQREAEDAAGRRLAALGIPIIQQPDGCFLVEMSDVRVFTGLPAFVRELVHEVGQQSLTAAADLLIQRPVDPELTPELAALGLASVTIYARRAVARDLARTPQDLHRQLRLAFEVIQSARWGGVLFPASFGAPAADGAVEGAAGAGQALLFPFRPDQEPPGGDHWFLLLEHEPEGRFLRITLETSAASRLFLKRIPHRVVQELGRSHGLQDLGQIAEQLCLGIQRECQNQRNESTELPDQQPALFELLVDSGLALVGQVKFSWAAPDAGLVLMLDTRTEMVLLLVKILLLLKDQNISRLLATDQLVQLVSGGRRVYLDVSRRGVCLNISIGQRRQTLGMDYYLARLPHLAQAAAAAGPALTGVRIVLIHHVTAEILGMIKALDGAGCAFLQTLFVRYKGIVPDHHLEALLSLPPERFRFHALQKVETRERVEGFYILSRQYSPPVELGGLDAYLRHERCDYLTAMRAAAAQLFFREAVAARSLGQRLLLVEDGGYLAPLLNTYCQEGRSLGDALAVFGVPGADVASAAELAASLESWLAPVFPGSIEHTRNGYDQLAAVARCFGRLAFPAGSIALSNVKNTEEARECATSILHAVESVFHGLGRIFSARNALVIGCRGTIGRHLMRQLSQRLVQGRLCGVDLAVPEPVTSQAVEGPPVIETTTLAELPEARFLELDLILGVVGRSVLTEEQLATLVLNGSADAIFFASGSTKSVEFAHLGAWLQQLMEQPVPVIRGVPVTITTTPVKDPQTGLNQGSRIRIQRQDHAATGVCKELYLLGDLMPINFLYYGVPAETMDRILSQLFRLMAGFIRTANAGTRLPPALLAVDREIDEDCQLLQSPPTTNGIQASVPE